MSILFRMVLAFAFMGSTLAFGQAPKEAIAPPAVQAEFDGFIAGFRKALKANDSAAVAGMTRLPFMGDKSYSTAAQFQAKAYPEFLPARDRACIQRKKALYDRDGENNDSYSIFCDERIFTFTKTPAGFLFTDVDVND